jgi:hypothetical protein
VDPAPAAQRRGEPFLARCRGSLVALYLVCWQWQIREGCRLAFEVARCKRRWAPPCACRARTCIIIHPHDSYIDTCARRPSCYLDGCALCAQRAGTEVLFATDEWFAVAGSPLSESLQWRPVPARCTHTCEHARTSSAAQPVLTLSCALNSAPPPKNIQATSTRRNPPCLIQMPSIMRERCVSFSISVPVGLHDCASFVPNP